MSNAIIIKKPNGNFLAHLAKSLKTGAQSAARLAFSSNPEDSAALDHIVARKLTEGHCTPDALCYADALFDTTVLLVDPNQLQTRLKHWLTENSVCLEVTQSLAQTSLAIATTNQRIGLVIVDLDSCGGIASVVSDLIAFRLKHPGAPVIIISAESVVDDFSTERLAITDVTLRGPVSMSRLDLALAEAQINNQVWQDRNATTLY